MSIQYPVKPRTVIRCDFDHGGFREPEMVKARPVIVVSPVLPHRDQLCTVVPLSTSPPEHDVPYIVRLAFDPVLPVYSEPVMWAKCDMIATVCFDRLDLLRTARSWDGKRKYLTPRISQADFDRVIKGILAALGIVQP
jgi:uncharacterized protein YifN (PemK superfamily)